MAWGRISGAAGAQVSSQNLKQITLAMHNYHDTYGRLPPSVVYDKEGRPMHSWRVLLLPYLEDPQGDTLYRQYRFDEPWDGPNNRALLARMPKAYRDPGRKAPPDSTFYQVFDGPNALFDSTRQMGPLRPFPPPHGQAELRVGVAEARFANVTDGTSNTLMVVEAERAVPWTKPEDIAVQNLLGGGPLPRLGDPSRDFVLLGFADGQVRRESRRTLTDATLRGLITRNGGEVVNLR
jgi:hypothetical protein